MCQTFFEFCFCDTSGLRLRVGQNFYPRPFSFRFSSSSPSRQNVDSNKFFFYLVSQKKVKFCICNRNNCFIYNIFTCSLSLLGKLATYATTSVPLNSRSKEEKEVSVYRFKRGKCMQIFLNFPQPQTNDLG